MTKHTFGASLEVGKTGEAVFSSLVTASKLMGLKDVSNEKVYQLLGIDFIFGKKKVGYDVKYDARASETGNIAIETVSVQRNGVIEKQGWLHTSHADYIVYLFDETQGYRLAFFTRTDLIRYANLGRTKTVQNRGYESVVSILSLKRVTPVFELRFKMEDIDNAEQQKAFRDVLTASYSGVN